MKLNTAQKCITGPASNELNSFGHCLILNHPNLHRPPSRPILQPNQIWRHQLLRVGIYRSSNKLSKMPLPTTLCRILVVYRLPSPSNLWIYCLVIKTPYGINGCCYSLLCRDSKPMFRLVNLVCGIFRPSWSEGHERAFRSSWITTGRS